LQILKKQVKATDYQLREMVFHPGQIIPAKVDIG